MKITAKWLTKVCACAPGMAWFAAQTESDGAAVVKKLMAEDRYDWANWLICRLFDRRQRILYAVFAAEQVLDIFEKKYPADKRPRLAIAAARACIDDDSAAAAAYAAYAAYHARAAANAAATNAATYAAYAAAAAIDAANAAYHADAAYAAYHADAAYAAANAAAYAAAYAAADRNKMKKKILKYGQTLFTTEEK